MSVHEISRRLINGIWRTVDAEENGTGGSQAYAPGTDRIVVSKSDLTIDHTGGDVVIDWTDATVQFVAGTALALVGGEITFVEDGCYAVHVHLPGGVVDDTDPDVKPTVAAKMSLVFSGNEAADGDDNIQPAALAKGGLSCNYVWCQNAGDTLVARIRVPGAVDGTISSIYAQIVKLSEVSAGDEFA